MNFPSPSVRAVIAWSYAVQEHPRTLARHPPLTLAYTRVQAQARTHANVVARVERTLARANLARLWKQFTSWRLSLTPFATVWEGRGWSSLKSVGKGARGDEGAETGWPETVLEHCNSSNVSFMQNTC